jgi:hypothetical protein
MIGSIFLNISPAGLARFGEIRTKVIVGLQNDMEKMDEPRETDKLFHQRLSSLEAKMEGIRSEVREAVSDIMEGEIWFMGAHNLSRKSPQLQTG